MVRETRETVYVSGMQLYAAVLNEAMSEHGENMSVLATSKTSEGFGLCFPVVSWLMAAALCGCGSSSCRKPVTHQMTLQVLTNLDFIDLKDNSTFLQCGCFDHRLSSSDRLGCNFLRVLRLFLASLCTVNQSVMKTAILLSSQNITYRN